ncbi:hypothetical protein OG401_00840 [Kitasatospora purpeofusca]|uniref:hypothetical protein n=1 Tax=Kitasatospora purpeofusca TaxID=67352 RepID=UPI002256C593|nr:hypothetical protein [Kitasatospora purpeofusca]MCX4682868.1 hypothetical protein [Kitasatospora purpeofusca]
MRPAELPYRTLVIVRGTDRDAALRTVLTPGEIMAAARHGALAVKLFPASHGGPAYPAALRAPFPGTPIIPVGGIDAATALAHLTAGATADGGDQHALRARATHWRRTLARAVTP